jgi:hypothetical protein
MKGLVEWLRVQTPVPQKQTNNKKQRKKNES